VAYPRVNCHTLIHVAFLWTLLSYSLDFLVLAFVIFVLFFLLSAIYVTVRQLFSPFFFLGVYIRQVAYLIWMEWYVTVVRCLFILLSLLSVEWVWQVINASAKHIYSLIFLPASVTSDVPIYLQYLADSCQRPAVMFYDSVDGWMTSQHFSVCLWLSVATPVCLSGMPDVIRSVQTH